MRTHDPKMIEILAYPPAEASDGVALTISMLGVILVLFGTAGLFGTAVWSAACWATIFFGACMALLGTVLRYSHDD